MKPDNSMPPRSDTKMPVRTRSKRLPTVLRERLSRLRGVFLPSRPRHASLSYRYFCKLLEKEIEKGEGGVSIAISALRKQKKGVPNTVLFLAYSLSSELNARVLIVDSVAKPGADTLSQRLKSVDSAGYLQLVSGLAENYRECIDITGVENVHFLPSGVSSAPERTIVNHKLLAGLIERLSSEYDYLIFLQGDIASDTRYMALSEQVDLNLLIAEENRTLMGEVKEREKLYQENDLSNYKIVLLAP